MILTGTMLELVSFLFVVDCVFLKHFLANSTLLMKISMRW